MPRIRHVLQFLLSFLALASLPLASSVQARPSLHTPQAAGDILVTPAGFDDMGEVLISRLGLVQNVDWLQIETSDLSNYDAIKNARTIFINCSIESVNIDPAAGASLRQFVTNGGTLYASDWAYSYIEAAFPGYIAFVSPEPLVGDEATLTATITDPGLRDYVFGSAPTTTIDLEYDLPGWAVIDRVLRNEVRVLMRGDVPTVDGSMLPNRPLAVSFPYGNGRVVYTTFHNEAQQSDEEKRIVEYLALLPTTTPIQTQVSQAIATTGLFHAYQGINLLRQDTTIEGTYTTDGGRALAFAAGWTTGTVRLSVFRPDGTLYAQVQSSSSPLLINVPAADASAATSIQATGTWRYTVTAVSVPSNPQAAVVGVGVTPSNVYLPMVVR